VQERRRLSSSFAMIKGHLLGKVIRSALSHDKRPSILSDSGIGLAAIEFYPIRVTNLFKTIMRDTEVYGYRTQLSISQLRPPNRCINWFSADPYRKYV
jgi:hypothetical protein